MARTKASVGAKIAAGKSSKARCSVAPPASSSSSSGSGDRAARNNSGGNPVCPRETPKWQKPITRFFIGKDKSDSDSEDIDKAEDEFRPCSSKSKPKKSVIQSDDEEVIDKTEDESRPGSSKSKPKQNVPQSEDEEIDPTNGTDNEQPTNKVLNDTIELEPLTGKESHKIQEYYAKNSKGKGVGKKTKDKENVDSNTANRSSIKRDSEEVTLEESPRATKKVKVN